VAGEDDVVETDDGERAERRHDRRDHAEESEVIRREQPRRDVIA
jgi:hypothetical protein